MSQEFPLLGLGRALEESWKSLGNSSEAIQGTNCTVCLLRGIHMRQCLEL